MQKLFAIAFVTTVGFAMSTIPEPAKAASAEEQRLCQDDAFRVCSHTIPDEPRTKACMVANLRKLSPGCRRIMTQSRRRR
jgi:hypothetical protein